MAATAAAQQQPEASATDERRLAPDVQRLFDAYVLMQAQERLALSDQQYPQFVQRLKALQDARRKTHAERAVLIQELARAVSEKPGTTPDEAGLRDRLRRLHELDERGVADLRRAYDALDQVLDLRQQARFRVFEEQMERRKVELLLRARHTIRARRGALNDPDHRR
jgi:hypothetical protein